MRNWISRRAPIASMMIACVALFVSLGGPSWAAKKLKLKPNSVKTVHIQDGAVTAPKLAKGATIDNAKKADSATNATNATTASNALSLGGSAASAYQKSCAAGAVWGFAYVDTSLVDGSLDSNGVAGFNCTGGAVRAVRDNVGDYGLVFDGSVTSFAVVSPTPGVSAEVKVNSTAPGNFDIEVHTSNGTLVDNEQFYIIAV
jgi:hypothetical protein